jgi:hypothetical protein
MAYSHTVVVVELGEGESASASASTVEGSKGDLQGTVREDRERVARRR